MTTGRSYPILFAILIALLALSACAGAAAPGAAPEQTPTAVPAGAPTAEPAPSAGQASLAATLGNLSYSGIYDGQPVKLAGGLAYDDHTPHAQAGAGLPFVRLIDHSIATGDLNGDGAEDAVAVLEHQTAGTGRFTYLVPVLNVSTRPMPGAPLMIGDRVQVKSLAIPDGHVIADLVAQGPGDAQCCPTWNMRKVYVFKDGGLIESHSETPGKAGLSDLDNTTWRLVDLNGNQEPALSGSEVTLHFAGGQIAGSAGCNLYHATVTSDEEQPQNMALGPIAATKKVCPDAVTKQETTYLERLARVKSWRYDGGYLALPYPLEDNAVSYLLFEPQPAASGAATAAPAELTARPWQ